MTTKAIVSALFMMSLGAGGFAAAQDSGERGEHGRDEQQQRAGPHERRGDEDRRSDQMRDRDEAARDRRYESRGAGPNHAFRRGDRLPAEYHNQRYVVDDWRDRHLSAPPRGYHWIRTGDDYVLVAVSTGVILQLSLIN